MAIGRDEREVAKVTVRATCQQTVKLLAWTEPFSERTWAIESAGGLGYLLAQQLVDAGEHVLDMPPTLASRGPGARHRPAPRDSGSLVAGGTGSSESTDHAAG